MKNLNGVDFDKGVEKAIQYLKQEYFDDVTDEFLVQLCICHYFN
jgi:hypothetical protein